MLAKLVVWDVDRPAAIRRMLKALAEVELLGLAHNVAFLRAAVGQPAFRAGEVYTGFLAEHRAALLAESERDLHTRVLAALVGHVCERAQVAASASPWSDTRSFRLNGPNAEAAQLVLGERELDATLEFSGDELIVTCLDQSTRVREERLSGQRLSFVADGARVTASYVSRPRAYGFSAFVAQRGACLELGFGRAHAFDEDAGGADGAIRSPLPGRILSVFVAAGAKVKRGDALISLEAMKMEHTLRASADGVVRELRVAARDQVAEGSTLLVVEAARSAE
jgi:3-methylcrotonyl-CoA carboxylase alpha subunit